MGGAAEAGWIDDPGRERQSPAPAGAARLIVKPTSIGREPDGPAGVIGFEAGGSGPGLRREGERKIGWIDPLYVGCACAFVRTRH